MDSERDSDSDSDNGDTLFDRGMQKYRGRGTDVNYADAFKFFRQSAEKGNAEAQNMLGECYDMGRGVVLNHETAVMWYVRSSNQGNQYAMYTLAWCFEHGEGVTKNDQEAMRLYSKVAYDCLPGTSE